MLERSWFVAGELCTVTGLESCCIDCLSCKSESDWCGELHGERVWLKVILRLQSVERIRPRDNMPSQLYLHSHRVAPPEMSLIVFTLPCCSY